MAGEENEIPPYVDESLNQNDIDQNDNNQSADQNERLLKLPITRIKTLIKMDPDVTLASQEAVVTLAKATVAYICHVKIKQFNFKNSYPTKNICIIKI